MCAVSANNSQGHVLDNFFDVDWQEINREGSSKYPHMIVTNILIIGQKMAFAMWINSSKPKLVFDNLTHSVQNCTMFIWGQCKSPTVPSKKLKFCHTSPHRVKVTSLNTPLHSQFWCVGMMTFALRAYHQIFKLMYTELVHVYLR